MDNFCEIHKCEETKFRVFLSFSDNELLKKITEVFRNSAVYNKFNIVIEAVKHNIANRQQFNYESECELGKIYAIKVDKHRFYTLVCKADGYRDLYICRYGKKESQENDKKLTSTITSIHKVTINILLPNG